jgi:hypothetical protein
MQLIGQVLKIAIAVPITPTNIHIVFTISLASIQQSIERRGIMRIVRITRQEFRILNDELKQSFHE